MGIKVIEIVWRKAIHAYAEPMLFI